MRGRQDTGYHAGAPLLADDLDAFRGLEGEQGGAQTPVYLDIIEFNGCSGTEGVEDHRRQNGEGPRRFAFPGVVFNRFR